MANLQVKDFDDSLYNALKALAKRENRSISQEITMIIQNYLSIPDIDNKKTTESFLQLSGSWDDSRSAEEIIDDIYSLRKNSSRFINGIFD